MIYNFRFDRNRPQEILKRIQDEKLLSQGWGGGPAGDLRVDQQDFVTRCRQYYRLRSTRVPTSLTKMRGFKDGDLLVTPHLPAPGKVSIHVVAGDFPTCYEYRKDDPTHQNHRIRLKESFGSDGSISIHNDRLVSWRAKLSWLRLPILDIARFEPIFRAAIEELRDKPEMRFEVSGLDGYIEKVRSDLLAVLQGKLNEISNSGGGPSRLRQSASACFRQWATTSRGGISTTEPAATSISGASGIGQMPRPSRRGRHSSSFR